MKRWQRITLWSAGAVVALLLVLWLGLTFYIRQHKAALLKQITEKFNDRITGALEIRDIHPSLFRSFPNISLSLEGVTLRDSLWQQHRHTLLEAKNIFVKINTLALLKRKTDIRQITLSDASIYLFTDSSGYSNTRVFRSSRQKSRRSGRTDMARFQLENVRLIIDNRQKHKHFQIAFPALKGITQPTDSGWTGKMEWHARIQDFSFNVQKGSYLKNKALRGSLTLQYNRVLRRLQLERQRITIDRQPLLLSAVFDFARQPVAFTLHIDAPGLPIPAAAAMLPPNISRHLDSLSFQKPLDVQADIRGRMQYPDTPLVRVRWKTTDNTLSAYGIALQQCSFEGFFYNEVTPGYGHNDPNSEISLQHFRAVCWNIPLRADTLNIRNLKHPRLSSHLYSDFPLSALNDPGSGSPFRFDGGHARMDLRYSGGLEAKDTVPPQINGSINIEKGALSYLPRNMTLKDFSALLDFRGQDLFLRQIKLQSNKSTLQMDGTVRNLTSLYFNAPEKLVLDWNIRSPLVDLNEFRSFLQPRRHTAGTRKGRNNSTNRIVSQLNVVMEACNVNMQLQVDRLTYRQFTAGNVRAGIALTGSGVRLQQIALSHAGGTMLVSGNVQPQGKGNRFDLNARLQGVHVDQLFRAFENFGLKSLTGDNLRGTLSATAKIRGGLSDQAGIVPHSLYGTVAFDLRNGALLHFAPLENIGTFVFRKRNLSEVTFDELKNTFELKGNKIIIPSMRIASSALNMDVGGVYGLPTGTDISIDVPLRNPQKDELALSDNEDNGKRKRRRGKGIVVHLRATDGEDGKVKIGLSSAKRSVNYPATNSN
ncbi:AsmA family protein [Compostibacter hankyongensis]|uniref:AsmA-like C-terminal region-containing protein n=1 Tax=Compostibacter hankyongensis TaxID=1007089 RepID=A0ABP8FHS6_9BACT